MQVPLLAVDISRPHLVGPEKTKRQQFRKVRHRCPKCKTEGRFVSLEVPAGQDRPWFQCQKCQHVWTCGKQGGSYAAHLLRKGLTVHQPERDS